MSNIEDQPATNGTDVQPVTEAGAPFDHADADVILRSSDHVDFRVFKLLLSLGSPFFKDMFALPQASEGNTSGEMKGGLPVVQVTEGRKVLEMLLFLCYPMDPPALDKLEDVDSLVEAAIKYNIERAEKRAREMLVDQRFLSVDPLRVFAIACRHSIEEEARAAAKATLTAAILERPYGPELELISAGKLYRLQQYHKRCVAAAREASSGFTWPSAPNTQYCSNCGNTFPYQRSIGRSATDAVATILRDGRLPDKTDLGSIFQADTTTCPYCSTTTDSAGWSMIPTNLGELTQQFFDVLENAVSVVNLELQL